MTEAINMVSLSMQVSNEACVTCKVDTQAHNGRAQLQIGAGIEGEYPDGKISVYAMDKEQGRGLRDSMAVAVQQLTAWLGDEEEPS